MKLYHDFPHYLQLMRVEKPIGWLLLLWPTLCAVWLASDGDPPAQIVWIFALGVFVMRSAGCVINDWADRDIDPKVERTTGRPLASGKLSANQALGLFTVLCAVALTLLLLLPERVWPWSIPALLLTVIYPFMKRVIQAPQLVLGIAFSFGIPMAYVALDHTFNVAFWLLLATNICWVLVYDSEYAMSDREDDLKIGINSTAILFGNRDKIIIGVLQVVVLSLLLSLMLELNLNAFYGISIALVAALFLYQQWLIRNRDRALCFAAFINNGWVGGIVWFGLLCTL